MDEKKLLELIDGQVWLLNTVRWALARAQDSLIECRTSMSGKPDLGQWQDEARAERGMTEEEEADSKVPASQEQITALLDKGGRLDKWVSERDADFWVHVLAEEEKAEKAEAAKSRRPSYSNNWKEVNEDGRCDENV